MTDGVRARINLKNDFRDIFDRKRITQRRRDAIEALVNSIRQDLIGIEVNTQNKSFPIARIEHWQNRSQYQYETTHYIGLDDTSLAVVKNILIEGLQGILE